MTRNISLSTARCTKNDEFYTRLEDIKAEVGHYAPAFKDQTVFCNCDDPEWSNFWVFFREYFDALKLQRLVATYYTRNGKSDGRLMCHDQRRGADGKIDVQRYPLPGDGDFRSPECLALLDEADVVCTNPPFSLFREFVSLIVTKKKRFLVIGDMNAITYKEVFPLIRSNEVWLGCTTPKRFRTDVHQEIYQTFGNKCWFTNLPHQQRNTPLNLSRSLNNKDADYDKYDNYEAINVNKTLDIPHDYSGAMGVPISFLFKYNPEQFEILGITKTWDTLPKSKTYKKQIQVSFDSEGKESRKGVMKLNDGPVIALKEGLSDKTHYLVDDRPFQQIYARIVIKRKSN